MKKLLVVLVLLIVVVVTGVAVIRKMPRESVIKGRSFDVDAAGGLIGHTLAVGTGLNIFLKKSHLLTSVDILRKLDFSPPLSEPCTEEPLLKVFKCRAQVPGGDMRYLPRYPVIQDFGASLEKNSKYYFTLANRVQEIGTDLPELIMVVASPPKSVCAMMNKMIGVTSEPLVLKLDTAINLTPTNEVVTEDEVKTLPPHEAACYEGQDGRYYYITTLVVR